MKLLLLPFVILTLTGCFPESWGARTTVSDFSRKTNATFTGDDCSKVITRAKKSRVPTPKRSAAIEHQVLLHICRRQTTILKTYNLYDNPLYRLEPAKHQHKAFSQRKFSPTAAALIVVSVYTRGFVREHMRADVANGLAAFYASKVDIEAVTRELGELGLSPDAISFFVNKYRTAKTEVERRVANFDPGLRMYLFELSEKVWRQREQHFKLYAAFYQRLDIAHAKLDAALVDDSKQAALVAELIAIRAGFMKECQGAACRKFPVYLLATEDVMTLHSSAEQAPAAYAEYGALRFESPPFERRFPHALNIAKRELAPKLMSRYSRYRGLVGQGTEPEQAAKMVGKGMPIVKTSPDHILQVPNGTPVDVRKAMSTKAIRFEGTVRTIKKSQGLTKVSFEGSSKTVQTPYDCRRTNRITQITEGGHVEYEHDCKYRRKTVSIKPPEPVLLPNDETASVRVGDIVRGYMRDNRGRVVMVERAGQVIQLRQHQVVPFTPTKARTRTPRW